MGGICRDYNLMTTIPGLYAIGEANFSDHGANRLGASGPDVQGLADGYFVLPYTIGVTNSRTRSRPQGEDRPQGFRRGREGRAREDCQIADQRKAVGDDIHKRLDIMMGERRMARTKESLQKAITEIQALRKEF